MYDSPLVPVLGNRSLFPSLRSAAYLNHAAASPLNARALQALQEYSTDFSVDGVGAFMKWERRREELKANLARLVGAQPEEIALGTNTSRGVTDIALSVPWRSGDRVVVFDGEFPANVTPWQQAAELFELRLVRHQASDFYSDCGLTQLEEELRRGVRLVAVSAVQFQTGLRMPLEELGALCRRYDAELFVDAIQACGVVPIDVREQGIDYLSCGGHKWLLGTEGAGFVYVSQERANKLRPWTAGWLSHNQAVDFLVEGPGRLRYDKALKQGAQVFENGTPNALGHAVLGASVGILLELSVEAIYRHVQAYHDGIEQGLESRGFKSLRPSAPARSGILAYEPSHLSAAEVAKRLAARGIQVGTPDGKLRFSPHYSNSLDEVDEVVVQVAECLSIRG